MQQSHSPNALTALIRNKWTERILAFVVIPALLLYSLWLPPVSIGNRLFHLDYPLVTPGEGGDIPGPYGAHLRVPAGTVAKNLRLRMVALTQGALGTLKPDRPEVLAVQSLPGDVTVHWPLFHLEALGQAPSQGSLSLALPPDVAIPETVDLFGWDGKAWQWMPRQIAADGREVQADLAPLPSLVMLASAKASAARISVGTGAGDKPLSSVDANLAGVNVSGLSVDGEGNIIGEPPAASDLGAPKGASVLLSIGNVVEGIVRSDLVGNLLVNEASVKNHVQKIVALATQGDYAGVEIAYAGIDPNLRPEFSAFIARLAEALHSANKTLAVRVPEPIVEGGSWSTGAYDWPALGRSADVLRIPALADPASYAVGGMQDKLLAGATSQVDRRKIELYISADACDNVGQQQEPIAYQKALALLAPSISATDADKLLSPGQAVSFSLPNAGSSPVRFDEDAQVYWFTISDAAGKAHTVWLENASSVARKLQYVLRYALGGALVEGALDKGNDPDIVEVLRTYQDNLAPPEPQFAYVWTVEDGAGKVISQQVAPLDKAQLNLNAPSNPGSYVVKAALSDDGGKTNLGAGAQLGFLVPSPTPTNTPTPTPTPTDTPTPTVTPTNTPKPTATPKPTSAASSAPSVAPARASGSFGYGIQADMVTDTNYGRIISHIKTLGFGWVKQQVEWFRYNPAPGAYDWGALDRIVDACNANGVNVLFSVVKAPKWAQPPGDTEPGPPADLNTFGTFLREMATRYKGRVKAYEVWNEQNLYYEWGGKGHKLNAARYVELLKVAYNAIKSVDPSAVVISGAPTPTGFNDGDTAIDDRLYLEQMYQAGLARYCDAVGIHPSGYNNPPDADWRTWSDASAPSFKGHPSFFFRGMMESYRNIMVKYGDGNKRLWATEFGWASVENLGAPPAEGYGYAADNTEAEQAQFIVRAYQMGKGYGFVGVMFLWNLNFAPVSGKANEKAAFGIVREDWGPRPAFAALRDMPK